MGLTNQKFFLLFVGYTMLMAFTALLLVIVRIMVCREDSCSVAKHHLGWTIGLVVTAVLFGLFTMCMLCDQLHSISTNTTGIDRLKGHAAGSNSNLRANLAEVFGGEPTDGFSLMWLLPTPIRYPDTEALTGFCFRNTPMPRSLEEMETLL